MVIANEANIENVTYGMLACSQIAMITEDSVAMVSEALTAQRVTYVLQLGNGRLPRKHRRFHDALRSKQLVQIIKTEPIECSLMNLGEKQAFDVLEMERLSLQEKLRTLL